MDAVLLDLELACIVGILPRERVEPQPLEIRIELGLDLDPCGGSGDLERSVDYAAVDTQIRFLCTEGRFRLIEVLAVAILRAVLAPPAPGESRAAVQWAEIEIRKPAVMRCAMPGVRIRRDADWAAAHHVLADVSEVRAERRTVSVDQDLGGPGRALLPTGETVDLPIRSPVAGPVLVVVPTA